MTKQVLPVRQNFRFFHRLRVRWVEVDMQKIVFNGHYLMYLDTAIADYWRAIGLPYEAAMHQLGGDLYVKKATLEYHASACYDDQIDVGMRCERIGNTSLQFIAGIFRGDQLLISGELIYVFANPATQTSQPVPAALRDVLQAYEAGESMLDITLGAWGALSDDLAQGARAVRTEVFLQEQRIPVEMEWDELDAKALHVVARNRLGMPLATGRLIQQENGVSRIGRMAVSRVLRGSGIGHAILQKLIEAARQRGDHEVMLHAQRSAEGFYAQAGFKARGEPFVEAGIDHIEMVKNLR